MQRFMRLIYYTKGCEKLSNIEKDIVIEYYFNPDKGDGVEDTKKVMHLLTKGMSLLDAKLYLVDCWSKHFQNYVECAKERLNNASKVIVIHIFINLFLLFYNL
jgi:hypothetical protein